MSVQIFGFDPKVRWFDSSLLNLSLEWLKWKVFGCWFPSHLCFFVRNNCILTDKSGMKCKYCGENAGFQIKSAWCCQSNVSKCPAVKAKISAKHKGKKPWNAGTAGMGICHSYMNGKTYEEVFGEKRAKQFKQRISQHGIAHPPSGVCDNEIDEKHRRQKISESIKQRYADGWMPKAGRCKKIRYSSPIAGDVLLDGTWELLIAQYLDKQGVVWQRNKNRFAYHFEEKGRFYTPDFYLSTLGVYLEVKGYETDKDRAKWLQFPHDLRVLRKSDIELLKSGGEINLESKAS